MTKTVSLLLVLVFYADLVEAFRPELMQISCIRRRATMIRFANPHDNDTSDTNNQRKDMDHSEALQQELNAVMTQRGSSMFDATPTTGQVEEATDLDLYNAAPLFTGAVVTVFSIAFTGYLIYAGITGDDPMTGHSLN